ncbi:hypothetical protein [Anaerosalibacter sp. Marseille-P3206]|uniref:hypothetical protein n=1 Tax=Anaerosalibacter sp. Marseille-P3206 TaxID=1871005 RepID=UPI0009874EBB|nr:hypothetical protein [Anaerosalibacter sp. Marseille-P3206]
MRLKEAVNIKPISTVIDFQSSDKTLIDGYIVLEQTGEYFLNILEGFTRQRDDKTTEHKGSIIPGKVDRCHKITGTYGMGKSYFLLMIKSMLESLEDKDMYDEIIEKFSDFSSILYQLDTLNKQAKRYIIVDINGKDFSQLDFKSVIERQVYNKLVKKIGKEKLNYNSFYEKTARQLIEWKSENSPMYNLFKDQFEDEIDFTYGEMIEGLQQRDRYAKEGYEKVYKLIMKEDPKDNFDTLGEFLGETDEIIKGNGYDGLVIIFDEFSSYLRGRSEAGFLNIDLGSIDILTESTMVENAKQIHFITTEHEDIEHILEKNVSNMDAVKKTAGRFKNYKLYFDRGSKLIENVIEKDEEKLNKIKFENINIFNQYDENNELYKLEEVYPMNPFTLEYLIKISEKYAQGDRTLFTFMNEELRAFVEKGNIYHQGRLNLLGVDAIMDSFNEVIFRGREEFAKAYNIQIKRTNTDLQKRIVKALALDYAITITNVGKIKTGINDSNIKYILSLNEEELKLAKEYFLKETNDSQSYIIFNAGANGYELSPDSAGIDIEEEIRKELPDTDKERLLKNLITDRSATLDIRTSYTLTKSSKRFPFDRYIEGKFASSFGELKELNIEEEIDRCSADGKIVFYLPTAGQTYNYHDVMEIAKEKSKELIDNRIALAIPKEFTFASDDANLLRRYEAVQRLTKNESIMSNPKAQNQLRLEIVRLRNEIYNKLSFFGRSENFIFLFKDEILEDIKSMDHLLTLWLVEKLYPKFPVIDSEDFSTRNACNQLIENLIVPGKAERVDLDSSKVFSKQIRWSLKPLDLVKLTKTTQNYRVEIKRPNNNSIVKEIFDLFAEPEEKLSIRDKYNILISPPYGLNDPMFEVLFAIFLRISDKYYLIDSEDRRIEVTVDTMKEVWNNYKMAEVKDSLPFIVKKDVINILEIIDKSYSDTRAYISLSPTMPSDDFGKHANLNIFSGYMQTFCDKTDLFIKNLEILSTKNFLIEKLDDIKKDVKKTFNIIKPDDLLYSISNIIDKHFDNHIKLNDSDNDIPISRYIKLQNFIDNTIWLQNNINDFIEQQKIAFQLNEKTKNIDIEAIVNSAKEAEDSLNTIINKIFTEDNWKNNKFESIILLDNLKETVNNAIEKYNESYLFNHNILNITKKELLDAIANYEFIPLIKCLENINFNDLDSLSSIKSEVNRIAVCDQNIENEIGRIIQCKSCSDLENIINNINVIKNKQKDIRLKLGSLADQYINKIDNLSQLEIVKELYNRDETIVEFVNKKYPKQIQETRNMMSIIRYDWAEHHDEIINLVNELYPIINEYIDNFIIIDTTKKRVDYNKIIKNISKSIELSGYKEMTVSEFKNKLITEIDNIKNQYDVIIIKE